MKINNQLIQEVKKSFINTFGQVPLLIFSPGRINIIGEHTDYNEGFVFPAAVNKGIVSGIQKSNTRKSTIIAMDMNSKAVVDINNINITKKSSWEKYVFGVVLEIQKEGYSIGNFNLVFKGNIPSGAGMSSSAALENSIVFSINELFELGIPKEKMIFISQKAEHNYVGVKCGIMDQYASMFGIKNHALHLDCRNIEAKPYKIDFANYQLMLINTNVKHSLSESAYNERRNVCERIAKLLNIKALRDADEKKLSSIKDSLSAEDYQKILYIIQENNRTIEASKSLSNNDLRKLGELMYASHHGLSTQYMVSCDELDFLVEKAKKNINVLGARMMGGGFGGCTINLVNKDKAKLFAEEVLLAYNNKFKNQCSVYYVELSQGTYLLE